MRSLPGPRRFADQSPDAHSPRYADHFRPDPAADPHCVARFRGSVFLGETTQRPPFADGEG